MGTWNSRGLRGSTLEEFINRTNERYMEQELALIQKIPTPITPVRIDKEHRHNIIDNFFTKLKGQVFILSTDEEINNTYTAKLSDKVSEQYLLKFESRGKTEVLKNQYFGGVDNGI